MSDLKTMCEHGAFVIDCSICAPVSRPAAVPDAVEAGVLAVHEYLDATAPQRIIDEFRWLVSALREARKQRDMTLKKADELLAEKRLLTELLIDVAGCGVESDLSPRYLTVQIDCETWAELQPFRRRSPAGASETEGRQR